MCAGLDFSQLIVSSLQASLNEFGKLGTSLPHCGMACQSEAHIISSSTLASSTTFLRRAAWCASLLMTWVILHTSC
jgi:hypothetical protein